MSVALTFPGQGSQRPGMAASWLDHPAAARWREASDVLGWDVARLGTDADADELREPHNCQVALFVHQAVLLDAWAQANPEQPVAVAGHSLGEYNALLASSALGFSDALRLVDERARATSAAAEARPGTMIACLGYPDGDVAAACGQAGAFVANDNAPGQVIVSGSPPALMAVRERLESGAARGRVMEVAVGAAYHSPHMEPALERLGAALDGTPFADAEVPVVANVDAQPHTRGPEWPDLLRRQVIAPVRWRETVTTLASLGAGELVELGASPVLTNLAKRIDRDLARRTVSEPGDI